MKDKLAEDTFTVSDVLRNFSEFMQTPVIVILILFIAAAIFLIGWIIGEGILERRKLKVDMPELLEKIRHCSVNEIEAAVMESGLLRRQKQMLTELTMHPDFTPLMREALAVSLLGKEKERYDRIVRLSDLISKLAPMFGLMGTLIPLGPGILALGGGDTYTLSESLLIAFDTTVAGLVSAAVALVISSIRKGWYAQYLKDMETVAECILEMEKIAYPESESAVNQRETAANAEAAAVEKE